jgi:hypothetical protein
MRSATGVPISACLSTATICSTLNRFRFTASSFPFPGAIMPETLPQIGIKIGEPTNSLSTLLADVGSENNYRNISF